MLDGFFDSVRRETGDRCRCSCHPQLPETDLHDYGADCPCRHTAEERRAHGLTWQAENDAFWASPEGRDIKSARQVEDDALAGWLATQPGVVVTSHGGWTPEQWRGSVDGHSFSFRERHDDWRIELDLAPSGRFVEVWRGGDVDDEARSRTHLRRRGCTTHTARLAELEQLLGSPLAWCPACGQRIERTQQLP